MLAILLPCLNEQRALPGLLARIEVLGVVLPEGWDLLALVVDDGSTDRTAAIASGWAGALRVVVLQHSHNLGLGAALAKGITWFLGNMAGEGGGERALAVMDADGTHPPELLGPMLELMYKRPGCDVVIASRYAPGGAEHGLPWARRLYSRLASLGVGLLARVRGARDYTCGFRLYRAGILRAGHVRYGEALVTERSFVCMAELLVKLARCGARVGEVPLDLHYELKGGVSKMNVAATIRRYAVLAFRLLVDPRYR